MSDDESENGENEEPDQATGPAALTTQPAVAAKRSLSPAKRKSTEPPPASEPKIIRTSPRLSKSPQKPSPTKRISNTFVSEKPNEIAQAENESNERAEPSRDDENDIMETEAAVEVVKEFNNTSGSNLNEPESNLNRQVDPNEICQDIFKFKRLANLTYIAPYMKTPEILPQPVLNYMPYFLSLDELAKEAATRSYMKCKVTAKLFEYSSSACPSIASVFVHCKKCNYVNFTPFHLANIYLSGQLTCILNDITSSEKQQQQQTQTQQQTQLQTSTQLTNAGTQRIQGLEIDMNEENGVNEDEGVKQAVNFSLNWLQTAFPASTNQIPFTQAMTQSVNRPNSGNQDSWAYEYECPRCILNSQEENEEQDTNEEYEGSILSYIYRFWFVLRDAKSRLNPCLIESELALKFLDRVEPIKFYTNSSKTHQVYKTIHKNFNKKFLFTLETFNLREESSSSSSASRITINNINHTTNKNKNVNVLYKIVDMEELVSM
jgi:hypothetical protein